MLESSHQHERGIALAPFDRLSASGGAHHVPSPDGEVPKGGSGSDRAATLLAGGALFGGSCASAAVAASATSTSRHQTMIPSSGLDPGLLSAGAQPHRGLRPVLSRACRPPVLVGAGTER